MSFYTNLVEKTKLAWNRISKENIAFKYAPSIGGVSYLLLSTEFTTPDLFSKVFRGYSLRISNLLMFNSMIGSFLYFYSTRHMKTLKPTQSIGFSTFGSTLFNFGSILFWVFIKSYLPENTLFVFLFGVLSGMGLLYTAKSYLDSIDANTIAKND